MRAARLVLLAAVVLAVTALSASAQTNAQNATTWGLLGMWKVDCSRRAGNGLDASQTYVIRDGKLELDRDFGTVKDTANVTTARIRAEGTLELVILYPSLSQTREFVLVKGPDGRIRSVSNRNVDTNEFSIRDGVLLANGNQSPWQSRCP